VRARWPSASGPVVTGLISAGGTACFAALRLWLAADGDITKFVRAALPYSDPRHVPAGLFVFRSDGYDGQFYYRLALDPANLHRTAFGITLDHLFRLDRIGYPALTAVVSLGQHRFVPVALVVVNVAALGAIGLAGGTLATESGRSALWGLLLPGYFGFFICVGCDLTEPLAAACLLGGLIACRRGHPLLAGLLLGYAAVTRETELVVPLALAAIRLTAMARRRTSPGTPDLAWLVPVVMFCCWQLILRFVTGSFVALSGFSGNSANGWPFGQFAGALRLNAELLWPATGAAYIWFAEVATLIAFVVAAFASLRSSTAPGYERLAFAGFVIGLGVLSHSIWTGHADLRSIDDCYLLAVLVLLGSLRKRLGLLTAMLALTSVIAAAHQALYL